MKRDRGMVMPSRRYGHAVSQERGMNLPSWLSTAALFVAVGLLIVGLAFIWWWVPKRHANRLRLKIRDLKARADIEDNYRKTLSQLFGGGAVLLGAAFAYYQSQVTAENARLAAKASSDLLISQQTSRGFEQLGNESNLVIRLGGIYALEGVMNTSEQYHKLVMEALAAFVREKAVVAAQQKPANEEVPDPKADAD